MSANHILSHILRINQFFVDPGPVTFLNVLHFRSFFLWTTTTTTTAKLTPFCVLSIMSSSSHCYKIEAMLLIFILLLKFNNIVKQRNRTRHFRFELTLRKSQKAIQKASQALNQIVLTIVYCSLEMRIRCCLRMASLKRRKKPSTNCSDPA